MAHNARRTHKPPSELTREARNALIGCLVEWSSMSDRRWSRQSKRERDRPRDEIGAREAAIATRRRSAGSVPPGDCGSVPAGPATPAARCPRRRRHGHCLPQALARQLWGSAAELPRTRGLDDEVVQSQFGGIGPASSHADRWRWRRSCGGDSEEGCAPTHE